VFQTSKKDCKEIIVAKKWCANLKKTKEKTAEVYTIECGVDHPDFSEASVSLRRTPVGRITLNLFVETEEGKEPVKRLDYDPTHPNSEKYNRRGISPTLHQVIAPQRGGGEEVQNFLIPNREDEGHMEAWSLLLGFLKEVRAECDSKMLHEWYHELSRDLWEVNNEN